MTGPGRNDPCPCGSGLKYKKYCLDRKDEPDHDAIANAVHQAVVDVTGTDGAGKCSLYAWAGLALVREATGRPAYGIRIGSAEILTGHDADGPFVLQMDPAVTGYNGREFHAWISDGNEVIDFALRHWPELARRLDVPWLRDPLPAYYWGSGRGLWEMDVRIQVDQRAQREYPRLQLDLDGDLIKATTERARDLLSGRARPMPPSMLVLDLTSGTPVVIAP